ncbi:MAG: hypothetical protein OK441_01020 [Thaumarchaeota archaeon]|nr:hypothetical protein [Nitrososphaerota archaeon]
MLDRGFLFLVLANIGDQPATKVVTKIGGKIMGPDGKTELNGLNVFRSLEFFAPGREFRVLVGGAPAYFASGQPTKFTAVITYSDQERNSYIETITHDLTIYKDLPHEVVRK